jgi:hypothetical protein
MNLKKELKKGEIIVLVIPNAKYTAELPKIAKYLSGNFKATAYVSLNKPFETLEKNLKKAKVDLDKFLFIDGITKNANPQAEEKENCMFVKSAAALTNISLLINKTLKTGKFDSLLFDSLSTLLIYNESKIVGKFVHNMVNKIKNTKTTAVFTALKGDTNSALLKEVELYVDKVIEYK